MRPTRTGATLTAVLLALSVASCNSSGTIQNAPTAQDGGSDAQSAQPEAGQALVVSDVTGTFTLALPPGFGAPDPERDITGAQQATEQGQTSTVVLFSVPPEGSVDAAGADASEDALIVLQLSPAQDVEVVLAGLLQEVNTPTEGVETTASDPVAVDVDGQEGAVVRTAVSNTTAGDPAQFVNETLVVNHGDSSYVAMLRGNLAADTTSQRMSEVIGSWTWSE